MFRWTLVGVTLVALVAVGLFYNSPRGVPVDVVPVQRRTIRQFIQERGKTALPDVAQITTPLQGRVFPITLREGDKVKQGDIVARMDDSELKTQLVEAENNEKQYQQSARQVELAIEQAKQTVLANRQRYDFFEREFGRISELFERNAASESAKNQMEVQMIEARVELRKAELQQQMYSIGLAIVRLLENTQAARKAQIERDLQRMVIRSPVSGVVLSREVSNERVLAAGTVLMEVGDFDLLEVHVEVLTQDAVTIEIGDPVEITSPAFGNQVARGAVDRIYPRGFPKVSSLGVEQQRVIVAVHFQDDTASRTDEQRRFGVEYRVRLKIFTDQRSDVLVIPRSAIFRNARGQWQVFAVRNGRAQIVPVEVGLMNDYDAEILDDLAENEPVIVAPPSDLEDGQPVEPEERTDLLKRVAEGDE